MRLSVTRGLKLLIVFALLLISLCGYWTLRHGNWFRPQTTSIDKCGDQDKEFANKLNEQRKRHEDTLLSLNKELRRLRSVVGVENANLLRLLSSPCKQSSFEVDQQQLCNISSDSWISGAISRNQNQSLLNKQQQQHRNKLYQTGISHETQAIRWESFTLEHVYHIENKLSPTPVEVIKGTWKKELSRVLEAAVELLNKKKLNKTRIFSLHDFLEGYSLCDKSGGIVYDIYFRSAMGEHLRYLKLSRMFAPLQVVSRDHRKAIDHSNMWINVILPLQGKLRQFKQFLQMFHLFSLKQDAKLFLTVVYFGEKGLEDTKKALNFLSRAVNYNHFQLLSLNSDTFSRMRGIRHAVDKWKGDNVIMLFTDVDVVFDISFIGRCRMNTVAGRRVYYPIVFGLYNPNVVYEDKPTPSKFRQLVRTVQTGSWRVDSYKIACQYRDDFKRVNEAIAADWDPEDEELFWGYRCSGFETFRAFDRALFYWFQERICDVGLPVDEYRLCIKRKALLEVSHRQIGLLAFKANITIGR